MRTTPDPRGHSDPLLRTTRSDPGSGSSNARRLFSVGRAIRGTAHTFDVYLNDRRIYFIRSGMGPGVEFMMAAHGGLLGWLIGRWFSNHQKKKQQQRAIENQGKDPAALLAAHKVNHAIQIDEIGDVSLQPGGWTLARGSVNWVFHIRGEPKPAVCTFRTKQDIESGLAALPRLFPALRIDVQLDSRTGKYLKKK